jgi:hypothetical protein
MCNKIKQLKLKRYDSTLQLYNTPEMTEVDQFFAALLLFFGYINGN